jgi:simple sugar transport system ATP-binding protein
MAPSDILELRRVTKEYLGTAAVKDVDFALRKGEIHALLGENGAGKSTLIKILSGVHGPTQGEIRLQDQPVQFSSPRDALDRGIATVYQDLATVPLMSVARNFFAGREPLTGWGPFKRMDWPMIERVTREEMGRMGIDIRDPGQPVGTLSGGERQSLAIARAVYFGAKVLILDEPTSALGVHQAAVVLRLIVKARARGLGVIFITHNVHHAFPVADTITLLNRGRSLGTFAKGEISRERVLEMMAGGKELVDLEAELAAMSRTGSTTLQ